MPYVGTISESASNTTLTSAIRLGSIRYSSDGVPQAALDSCPGDSGAGQATSAYIQAQVTFSYTQGSLAADVYVDPTEVIGTAVGSPLSGVLVVNSNGSWVCDPDSSISFSLQPHQSLTMNAWLIIGNAISNTNPTLTRQELNDFSIALEPSVDEFNGSTPNITVTGPKAASCDSEPQDNPELLPYAQLPFTQGSSDGVSTTNTTCTSTAGTDTGTTAANESAALTTPAQSTATATDVSEQMSSVETPIHVSFESLSGYTFAGTIPLPQYNTFFSTAVLQDSPSLAQLEVRFTGGPSHPVRPVLENNNPGESDEAELEPDLFMTLDLPSGLSNKFLDSLGHVGSCAIHPHLAGFDGSAQYWDNELVVLR